MSSTTRKWLSAISVGLVLLAVVLWLVKRRPQSVVAPAQPAAEVVATPAVHKGDEPAVLPSASVPATSTASTVILLPKPAAIATQPDIPQVPTTAVAATSAPDQPAASEPVSPAPETATPATTNEVAATARMYAAHASLRAPAVADPDSDQNRQILQAMITKALGPTGDQPTPTTNR